MKRNQLLAVAAGIGAVAGAVRLAGKAIALSHALSESLLPTSWKLADTFDLVGVIFMAAAFAVAVVAFRRTARAERKRLLGVSAGLFALYGLAVVVSDLIFAVVEDHLLPPGFARVEWFAAGSAIALVIAAVLIGIAMRSASSSRGLGWGCLGLALYFALGATALALDLARIENALASYGQVRGTSTGTPGHVVASSSAAIGGAVIGAVAAALAAGAFLGWLSRRDQALCVAASGLGLGFLTGAVGLIIDGQYGHGTANWLQAVSSVVLAMSAACGAVAFWRSSQQCDRPDFAVLPDTA